MKRTALKSGLLLSFGMILGRLSGLLREGSLAHIYGASETSDLAILMFTLPDLLIGLFIGGALSVSFMPLIQSLDLEYKRSLLGRVQIIAFGSFAVIALLLYFFTPTFIQLLAPGLEKSQVQTVLSPLRWTLLAVPLLSLAAVTRAFLQSENKFTLISFENLIFNFFLIFGILFVMPTTGLYGLASVIIIGVCLRWIPQQLRLRTLFPKKKIAPKMSIRNSGVLKRYVEALCTGAIIVGLPLIGRAFASFSDDGSIALFNYAFRVIEIPVNVGLGIFSTVVLPRLSLEYSKNQITQGNEVARNTIVYQLLFSIPLTLVSIWFFWGLYNKPLSLGALNEASVSKLALLCMIGISVLPLRGLTQIMITTFSARKETRIPLQINLVSLLFSLPLFWLGHRWLGLNGVFVAMVVIYLIMFLGMLMVYLKNDKKLFSHLFSFPVTVATLTPLVLLFPLYLAQNHLNIFLQLISGGIVFTLAFSLSFYIKRRQQRGVSL